MASPPKLAPSLPSRAQIELRIELGRTQIYWEDALRLRAGSIVPLDTQIADPVDIVAAGRLVARGELMVLEDKLCVRVTELVRGLERLGNEAA